MNVSKRKKVLFVAEAVTLAHIGRPLALADALDPERYEVYFACAEGYEFCFRNSRFTPRAIKSIPSAQFLAALAAGSPVYDYATLCGYVLQDQRLLQDIQPDIVVGDFRLSLSVSARLSKIPFIAISNAYWSPYVRQHYTVPDIPVTKVLPVGIANLFFNVLRPAAFALHCVPLNRVRRKFGLPSLGFDLRKIYTDADHACYADVPELFPAHSLPQNHSYLGPIIWSPPITTPAWWDVLPTNKPVVYVTLGSSGQGRLLPLVLEAVASLPVTVVAASAGKINAKAVADNIYVAEYLPGEEAARRASLVICNGGSPTSHQALAAGVPVIGIAGNLDQFLNMVGIEAAGAGKCLRADRFDANEVRNMVKEMISRPVYREAATQIMEWFGRYRADVRFGRLLDEMLSTGDTLNG
ncbi:MAG: PGL/p-HBAD biosynthesis rhamnosyltransferase [Noviherbaspirillum sp.]|nr:PGL/p-HBAD biosynthesis rhamnosyltransferase [Noviherbaspirillum sp.]